MIERNHKPIVYLDANVFIFFFEANPTVSDPVKKLFQELRRHPGAGVTSELTLAEVLAGSHQEGPQRKRAYLDLIVWSKFLALVPINREILYESAELRRMHQSAHDKKLDLPDAIHLFTAIREGCSIFASADRQIMPPSGMKRINPDAAGVDEILAVLS
jgi:predicted nucleic acid-binding protein